MAEISNKIDFTKYEPKSYHTWIFNDGKNWNWLPFAPFAYLEIYEDVKGDEFYIKPEELSKFIVSNQSSIQNIKNNLSGELVPVDSVMFIKGKHGYCIAIEGHYRPIAIKNFDFTIN